MTSSMWRRVRELAGVAVLDLWRYERALRAADESYLLLCNRYETLARAPSGTGVRCEWQWASDLHAPTVNPGLGLRLMQRCLRDHPFAAASSPGNASTAPKVTFIIGHRGQERLAQLLATLGSIAAQNDVAVECIVVEQDTRPLLAGILPAWVHHVHTPPPDPEMAYCRSWAFNVGARHARSGILVLHDNDMLVPQDYASCLLTHFREGYEVVNLKRFVFYLSQAHTRGVVEGRLAIDSQPPELICQNLEAGGSVAVTREAYDRIGGMDESFIGWGGEDTEWWERAQALRVWPYSYLPLVHLWHSAQAGKHQPGFHTQRLYQRLAAIPPAQRTERLRMLPRGEPAGPTGYRNGVAG